MLNLIAEYIVLIAVALVLHWIISVMIRRFGWRRENFRGEMIPSVFGLYIMLYGTLGALFSRYTSSGSDPAARLYLVGILGFGLLGLVDDLFGSREVGGFRGHFKKLLLEGRLTTGAAKAIGGGVVALYLGYSTSGGMPGIWALDAAVIALAANTVNLLDLRPGRALFVFFFGLSVAVILVGGWLSAPLVVVSIAVAAAGVAIYDVRGRAMLGDVGSNSLGAALGLTLVLDASVAGKLAVVVVFLAINYYSERHSISQLIERHSVLRSIDSRLGVR